jgi:phosphonopyruvate decarboxylase
MISPDKLFFSLKKYGVGIFAGVPDSLLKNFCDYIEDNTNTGEHIIAANEGNAIAIATGYHLSTSKFGVVYMQNSGLGNAANPLISIADTEVYQIPMLLIVGWRGEPGLRDEPQHVKQGRITKTQLEIMDIPYWIIGADSDLDEILEEVFAKIKSTNSPVALLVCKNTFSPYKSRRTINNESLFRREDSLRDLLNLSSKNDLLISTTGKTSRELYELRIERGETPCDFLTVGGMGHTSSIALGVALGRPDKKVVCIDGDGSTLMHLGATPVIGDLSPNNFIHVILNNAAHESVGGQPTVAGDMDFALIANACGYKGYELAKDSESLKLAWKKLMSLPGPVLLEIKIDLGSRKNLGRPTSGPIDNKQLFMDSIHD